MNIHLVLEERPNALVVPSAAIQNGLQGAFVWTTASDAAGKSKAKIQPVKVALSEGQLTIVDSGLEMGQQVVVDGADRLRPDQPVIVSASRQQRAGQGSSEVPSSAANLFTPGSAAGDAAPAAARGQAGGDGGQRAPSPAKESK